MEMANIVLYRLQLISLLFLFLLLCQYTHSQPLTTHFDCNHPTNYSDFNAFVMNNTAIIIGGSSENTVEIWTKDIMKEGLSVNRNCWSKAPTSSSNAIIQAFEHGVGFALTTSSIALQAGDYDTWEANSNSSYSIYNISNSDNISVNDANVLKPTSLMTYDILSNVWTTHPSVQGDQPSPRARMSVTVNSTTNIAWFFGGRSTAPDGTLVDRYSNSFYSFDINKYAWDWPTIRYSGGYRPARYGHTSNLISGRIFVLGGKMVIHSTDTKQWVMTSAGDFQSVLIFDTVTHQSITAATFGDVPPARYSFTAVNAPDGKSIVLFGGQNVSSEQTFDASNDIYLLDTCSLNWSKPEIHGTRPLPRAGHQAILYHNNQYMIILMGMQNYIQGIGQIHTDDIAILDMTTWTWVPSIAPNITNEDKDANSPQQAKCRFSFPAIVPDDDGDNTGDENTATTLLSNDNDSSSSRIKKLAVGITFGVLGFTLLTTAVILYILKLRKDADPTRNPRWLPPNMIFFDKRLKRKSSNEQEDEPEETQPQPRIINS
ncbi:hypothetical protein BDF20DRAFT_1001355 [Mycotypha africana]|uniref:uncharacterized protein n=1 Tax=Mycotypha africana TaxID=64632 RepID=UPI002301413C|nr:uncharacterized protein BDF20DRAFT_1001355 [Mycotypha africana]KAI8977348.1 hypothetical protein BDF20DRAFT_1001355 [Mycotypha africana]